MTAEKVRTSAKVQAIEICRNQDVKFSRFKSGSVKTSNQNVAHLVGKMSYQQKTKKPQRLGSAYRLHLLGDGGDLLDFGPELISLLVHHLLQLQHHFSLLPLDVIYTHHKWTQTKNYTQCVKTKQVLGTR